MTTSKIKSCSKRASKSRICIPMPTTGPLDSNISLRSVWVIRLRRVERVICIWLWRISISTRSRWKNLLLEIKSNMKLLKSNSWLRGAVLLEVKSSIRARALRKPWRMREGSMSNWNISIFRSWISDSSCLIARETPPRIRQIMRT